MRQKGSIKRAEPCLLFICSIIVCIMDIICGTGKPGLWIEDEFGYFGTAAFISGFDWSEAYSGLGYYGFGYGILFIPAFLLCNSVQQLMTYTLCVNVILLVCTFLLAVRLTRKLFPEVHILVCYLCVLTVTTYINNLAQIQMGWSETINFFLYWCAVNTYYNVISSNRVKDFGLFAVILCLLIMVHMRNIVVVAPCLLMLMIHCFKKKV